MNLDIWIEDDMDETFILMLFYWFVFTLTFYEGRVCDQQSISHCRHTIPRSRFSTQHTFSHIFIFYFPERLSESEEMAFRFVTGLRLRYPMHVKKTELDLGLLYQRVLNATIDWDSGESNSTSVEYVVRFENRSVLNETSSSRNKRDSGSEHAHGDYDISQSVDISRGLAKKYVGISGILHPSSNELEIAHKLHYASLAVLSVLLIEVGRSYHDRYFIAK